MDFNWQRYGDLLAGIRPVVIETAEEHEEMMRAAEALMEKGEAALSPEEKRVLALLVFVIELHERGAEDDDETEEAQELELPRPHETLGRLMTKRGWDETALLDIFGNPAAAREAMAGRRPISRGQAKQLGKLFRVPPKLFES